MKKTIILVAFIIACSIWDEATYPNSTKELQSARVKLYALDGGHSFINDKSIFDDSYSDCDSINLSVTSFLIKHPKGNLIWDTGMPGKECQIESQLKAAGISSFCEVDFLAFSHWHYDHTGNANLFRHSTIIGQRDEYEYALSNAALKGFGMKPDTYSEIINNPTILFDGDLDVFGDGLVKIFRVGGHTMGSQILKLKLKSKTIILGGDTYHFEEQKTYKRVPKFNYDSLETIKAMNFIDSLLIGTQNSELWITHDPEQMSQLLYSPYYYE